MDFSSNQNKTKLKLLCSIMNEGQHSFPALRSFTRQGTNSKVIDKALAHCRTDDRVLPRLLRYQLILLGIRVASAHTTSLWLLLGLALVTQTGANLNRPPYLTPFFIQAFITIPYTWSSLELLSSVKFHKAWDTNMQLLSSLTHQLRLVTVGYVPSDWMPKSWVPV